MTNHPIIVSVVIKALNEEQHIEAAVSSALAAVETVGGEVILADSISSDRTVEIASRFPVTIVQLKNAADRCCGVGPQLGYQAASGDYIYILDGDMELDPNFLSVALKVMVNEPNLAGVAGLIEEKSANSYQFRGRKRRKVEAIAGNVRWLDMGGLYRRSALVDVGYFSNKNLHAYEEMELGLRLTDHGWHLKRLPVRSVLHYGYTEGNWALLKRRWSSRYLDGAGELLRASLGKNYFWTVVKSQKHLFVGLALWICVSIGLLLVPITTVVLFLSLGCTAILVVMRAYRIGNFSDALFGQVVWQVTSLAMVRGFLTVPKDPCRPVDSVILTTSGK